MARTPKKQSAHDREVRELARQLQREGHRVKADLPGFEQPTPIGKDGRIPDIEATKRAATTLIEVETKGTDSSHKAQQSTFRRSATHRKRTTFKKIIIGE